MSVSECVRDIYIERERERECVCVCVVKLKAKGSVCVRERKVENDVAVGACSSGDHAYVRVGEGG